MKNVLRLSLANIRRSKSQAVGLLVFVTIAAMFLNIGLVIFLGVGSFFDERAEQNHSAHFTGIYEAGVDSIEQGLRFMENYEGVTELEVQDVIGGWGNHFIGDADSLSLMIFSRIEEMQKMDVPVLVGEAQPLINDTIYIPYFLFLVGDYKLGDEFRIDFAGEELYFTVAGTTEEIMFGAQMNSMHRYYISDGKYTELEERFPGIGLTLLSARLTNAHDDVFFQAEYNRAVSTEGLHVDLILENARMSRTMVAVITAIVITVFAIILLVVSLIVIRFRIINSIEESMTNIGAQKAIGYRNVQIVSSVVLQFGLTALIGGFLGVTLSLFAIPVITGILEPIIALVWNPEFNPVTAITAILTVAAAVTLISFITARKINKLHPLTALRGGLTTHSFKRNALPLEKSRANLNFTLALKQLLQNKKQAFAIVIIIAAVTMSTVAGIAVNYSMNEGRDSFARAVFGELPDVVLVVKSDVDAEDFNQGILQHPDVRKSFGYNASVIMLLIDETSVQTTVVEDCSLLEGNMLIRGRYPKHSNEIALGTAITRVGEKGVGDTVTIRVNETEKEFIVTGIVQFMNQNGFNSIITEDGYRELQPDYINPMFAVYLNNGVDAKVFLEEIKAANDELLDNTLNIHEQMNAMLNSMGSIFGMVAIGIVSVTALVVILTLYMVIKTTILRRRHELGIKKALGFTTLQLMNQIALNLTPAVILGVILGAIIGSFGFNPMMTALMNAMGIVQLDLPVSVNQIIIACIVLVVLSYGVSMLIAMRIRKISAYALVNN